LTLPRSDKEISAAADARDAAVRPEGLEVLLVEQ
jgi:hypothetical protein